MPFFQAQTYCNTNIFAWNQLFLLNFIYKVCKYSAVKKKSLFLFSYNKQVVQRGREVIFSLKIALQLFRLWKTT